MKRKLGEETQEPGLRPAVRRLVLLRKKDVKVPFSLDGPLTWGEIEILRGETFTPALVGLLPEQAVRPGDRWAASFGAVQELTGLERAEQGQIECRLEEITSLNGRRHARVGLAGSVRGVNQDGPIRCQLDGYFYFDLESNHLSYLSFKGVNSLLDKDGKESGRIEGRFVLTRQATPKQRTSATRPCAAFRWSRTRTIRSSCTTIRSWAYDCSIRGVGGSAARTAGKSPSTKPAAPACC